MTVKDLREALEGLPDDLIVIMSKDAEGNGYSPLADVDPGYTYWADSTYSGEAHPTKPDDVDEDDWDYWWDEGGVPCLLLDPTN